MGTTMKGLLLCHGHNHSTQVYSLFPIVKFWYLIDGQKDTYPDYVADVTDEDDMAYFKDNTFDYIVAAYCPIHSDSVTFSRTLNIMRRIGKPDVTICFPSLYSFFYDLATKSQVRQINKQIDTIIGKSNVENFRRIWNSEEMMEVGDGIYHQIVVGNYNSEGLYRGDEIDALMDKEGRAFMNRYLKEHQLKIKAELGDFVCIEPI